MACPGKWKQRLTPAVWLNFDPARQNTLPSNSFGSSFEVYDRFFELAPAGQDYFKQSATRSSGQEVQRFLVLVVGFGLS